jgi:hypothetical protein
MSQPKANRVSALSNNKKPNINNNNRAQQSSDDSDSDNSNSDSDSSSDSSSSKGKPAAATKPKSGQFSRSSSSVSLISSPNTEIIWAQLSADNPQDVKLINKWLPVTELLYQAAMHKKKPGHNRTTSVDSDEENNEHGEINSVDVWNDDYSYLDFETVNAIRKMLQKENKFCRGGIPIELRPLIWSILIGARNSTLRLEQPLSYYSSLCKQIINKSYNSFAIPEKIIKEIERDCARTKYSSGNFFNPKSIQRILLAFVIRNPTHGYCQSMSHVAAFLRLFYSEENTFWFMVELIENYLPSDYYSASLLGSRTDVQVFKLILAKKLTKLSSHFLRYSIDIGNIVARWFMCLFILNVGSEAVARIFDCFFSEGTQALFAFALATLEINKKLLLSCTEQSELLQLLNNIGQNIQNNEEFLKIALKSSVCEVSPAQITKYREEIRKILLEDYQVLLNNKQIDRLKAEKRRKLERRRAKQLENNNFQLLEQGILIEKLPKGGGKPKQTKFFLIKQRKPSELKQKGADSEEIEGIMGSDSSENEEIRSMQKRFSFSLRWESKKKRDEQCSYDLSLAALNIGAKFGQFKGKKQFKELSYLCFSFVLPQRTLDIIAQNLNQANLLLSVLKSTSLREISFEEGLQLQYFQSSSGNHEFSRRNSHNSRSLTHSALGKAHDLSQLSSERKETEGEEETKSPNTAKSNNKASISQKSANRAEKSRNK